jgi:hypothetical protein
VFAAVTEEVARLISVEDAGLGDGSCRGVKR